MSADPFPGLDDAALTAMANRAWREASRCWADFRRQLSADPAVSHILHEAAMSASAWSDELQAAVIRRASDAADR